MTRRNLLVVDDEEGIRIGLERFFSKEGFEVRTAEDSAGALELINRLEFAAAVVDVRLLETLNRGLELLRLKSDNEYLKGELLKKLYDHDIVTRDPVYRSLLSLADRVKDSEASVLLTGESGTGKEVMARYMHFTGSRREGPFVDVNCAALSESLLLSELFGHERGSFTGAVEKRLGKFELAHRGTLFLDEIGDMATSAQAKFLRVLEESSFERVGGTKKISVDIRVITATNKDLGELIKRGDFRSDLFFRLNIVNIRMPPLRERRGDIPLLVDYFVAKYARKYNKPVAGASPDLVAEWTRYDWPGNVRELQNAVNQAVLLSSGPLIDARSLSGGALASPRADAEPIDVDAYYSLKELHDAVAARYEKLKIERCLAACGWNCSKTAIALDVTRKTLAAKMREYGISRPCSG